MSSHLVIKRLNTEDLELAKAAFIKFLNEDETISSDQYLLELLQKEDFYGLVALQDSLIVGRLTAYEFMKYHNNAREVYLYEIDVDPEFFRQGIATKLIEKTIQICKERNVDYMFVGTEADNLAAQGLYAKTGGRLEGNLPHFEYSFKFGWHGKREWY